MWRGAIVAFIAAVALLCSPDALAIKVWCGVFTARDTTPAFIYPHVDVTSNYMMAGVSDGTGAVDGGTLITYVSVGAACPGGTTAVVLGVGDYDMLVSSGQIVTKLSELGEWGLIAFVCVMLMIGFRFGWAVVQRGTSQ